MSTPTFDPTAPLPGPPDPWASTSMPTPRDGPPFHMTDMIAAEPALTARILERQATPDSAAAELASSVGATLRSGERVVITGCGTSEHAALGVAEILRAAARSAGGPAPDEGTRHEPVAAQAFELALDPPSNGLVIGISHEGATNATNAALSAARSAGARTALITVSGRSPGAQLADIVVETDELDQSWCHTVGYLSPLVAAAAIAGHLVEQNVDPASARALVGAGLAGDDVEAIADSLATGSSIVVIASGADRPAGRELVLKVEEGAWLPAAYRDLETFLHGHLAATGDTTCLVLILTDRDRRTERIVRARGALAAARGVGIVAAAILARGADEAIPAELTPAGRILVPEADDLSAPIAALLGSATPLQTMAERIARARGVNPDSIHRDDPRYAAAAEAAENA